MAATSKPIHQTQKPVEHRPGEEQPVDIHVAESKEWPGYLSKLLCRIAADNGAVSAVTAPSQREAALDSTMAEYASTFPPSYTPTLADLAFSLGSSMVGDGAVPPCQVCKSCKRAASAPREVACESDGHHSPGMRRVAKVFDLAALAGLNICDSSGNGSKRSKKTE
jgi:hypothetical protein